MTLTPDRKQLVGSEDDRQAVPALHTRQLQRVGQRDEETAAGGRGGERREELERIHFEREVRIHRMIQRQLVKSQSTTGNTN